MWRYNYIPDDNDYLMHYGVKGMKWDKKYLRGDTPTGVRWAGSKRRKRKIAKEEKGVYERLAMSVKNNPEAEKAFKQKAKYAKSKMELYSPTRKLKEAKRKVSYAGLRAKNKLRKRKNKR